MSTQQQNTAKSCSNKNTWRLVSTVGLVALGGYTLTRPRIAKMALGLGSAALVRRYFPAKAAVDRLKTVASKRAVPVKGHAVITILAEPSAVYNYWRHFHNAPNFMSGIEDVRTVADNVAVWKIRTVRGKTFTRVAEITEDRPGESIAWRTIGSDVVKSTGHAQFRNGATPGTCEVLLEQEISLPIAISRRLTQSLMNRRLHETLRRLKQLLEAGEVARTEGQSSGDRSLGAKVAHDYVKPVVMPA